MIYFLGIGNQYQGEAYQLPDCELDVENMAAALEPFLAWGKCLLGGKGTERNTRKALAEIGRRKKASDVVVVDFSGHGTSEVVNGKQVQGIVWADGTVGYEATVRQMLAGLSPLILFSDSCCSGGLAKHARHRAKYVPHNWLYHQPAAEIPTRVPKRTYQYMAACKAGETAASTGSGGAFHLALAEVFAEHPERLTFKSLYKGVRKLLPNANYQQTPQLTYSDANFVNRTLKSFTKSWNRRPNDG